MNELELCNKLGFESNPFQYTDAEREKLLPEYFVPPPYFDSVWGDPITPMPTVVLAPRGSGKTAQKKMIEIHALSSQIVLPISYNRFEFTELKTLDDVALDYHISNICRLVTAAILSFLEEKEEQRNQLSKWQRIRLASLTEFYLSDLSSDYLRNIAEAVQPLSAKARIIWNAYLAEPAAKLFATFASGWGWMPIEPDFKLIGKSTKSVLAPLKSHLEMLADLAKTIGFVSIYVLIDKVDETELTGNDSEQTFKLLTPILKDLDFLSLRGYGFKFFLWDALLPYYIKSARPDRVAQYHLEWTRPQLHTMLQNRLQAHSKGRLQKLSSVSEDIGSSLDELVVAFSQRSPRNVIRICEKILSEQLRITPDAPKLTRDAINQGLTIYCNDTLVESFGTSTVSDLRRVGRVEFTITHLVDNVFKTTANACRNKVTAWTKAGLVAHVSDIQKGKTGGRPINNYRFIDTRAALLAKGNKTPIEFVRAHLLECTTCHSDQIIDLDLINLGQVCLCSNCGGSLGIV